MAPVTLTFVFGDDIHPIEFQDIPGYESIDVSVRFIDPHVGKFQCKYLDENGEDRILGPEPDKYDAFVYAVLETQERTSPAVIRLEVLSLDDTGSDAWQANADSLLTLEEAILASPCSSAVTSDWEVVAEGLDDSTQQVAMSIEHSQLESEPPVQTPAEQERGYVQSRSQPFSWLTSLFSRSTADVDLPVASIRTDMPEQVGLQRESSGARDLVTVLTGMSSVADAAAAETGPGKLTCSSAQATCLRDDPEGHISCYEQLGVSKDASVDDIKRAFKNLAKQYHPDVNPSPGACERFQAIKEACEMALQACRCPPGHHSPQARPVLLQEKRQRLLPSARLEEECLDTNVGDFATDDSMGRTAIRSSCSCGSCGEPVVMHARSPWSRWTCDLCGRRGLKASETLWGCKSVGTKCNWGMCSDCHAQYQHHDNNLHHSSKVNVGTHFGVTCDGCESYPMQGLRFKCKVCKDFDLCEACFSKRHVLHDSSHAFQRHSAESKDLQKARRSQADPAVPLLLAPLAFFAPLPLAAGLLLACPLLAAASKPRGCDKADEC